MRSKSNAIQIKTTNETYDLHPWFQHSYLNKFCSDCLENFRKYAQNLNPLSKMKSCKNYEENKFVVYFIREDYKSNIRSIHLVFNRNFRAKSDFLRIHRHKPNLSHVPRLNLCKNRTYGSNKNRTYSEPLNRTNVPGSKPLAKD